MILVTSQEIAADAGAARWEGMMDDLWLIRENIARYHRLIEAEADGLKRGCLERLLAECVATLRRGDARVPTAFSVRGADGTPDADRPALLADKP